MEAKDYEERKQFLEDLKRLVKSEQEALFRILKTERADFTENSNGIFFDVSKLSVSLFQKIKDYMEFCRKNRDDFSQREEEERKAQELITNMPV
jgi:hypothetical protein